MKNLTATLCLMIAVLLGNAGVNPTFAAGGKDTQQGRSDDTEVQRGLATVKKFNLALKALEKEIFQVPMRHFYPSQSSGLPLPGTTLRFFMIRVGALNETL